MWLRLLIALNQTYPEYMRTAGLVYVGCVFLAYGIHSIAQRWSSYE